ncbi:MAG: transposase [Propionivibrio sp.]|jgi:transposase-like protein|nr:transposase [Propionivibrio sp.]
MEIQKPIRRRRYHREEFKQAVIAACCEPGASVAGIAMVNGVNANQVRRWMRERGISAPTQHSPVRTPIARAEQMAPAFIPVPIAPAPAESLAIRIEIRRGNAAIKIDWPTDAAGACATWLRDWLR